MKDTKLRKLRKRPNLAREKLKFFDKKIVEKEKIESKELESWLNAHEAAEYLRLSLASLRNMTSNGHLPHYKLGKRVRFLKSELRELLLAHKRGS